MQEKYWREVIEVVLEMNVYVLQKVPEQGEKPGRTGLERNWVLRTSRICTLRAHVKKETFDWDKIRGMLVSSWRLR